MPLIVPVPPGWRARFKRTAPRAENPSVQGEMWGDTDDFFEKPIAFAQPYSALAQVTWYCVKDDGTLYDPTKAPDFLTVCGPMQGIPSGSPEPWLGGGPGGGEALDEPGDPAEEAAPGPPPR